MSAHGTTVVALLGLLAMMGAPSAVRADDPPPTSPLRASIICEAPPAAGRFRCDVEARVSAATLAWADVEVIKVDEFILPLRGRLGPKDASAHDADIYRWSLGFVAKGRGSGDVTVRVRAVVCRGSACATTETDVSGRVIVGR